ncbi:hypothetical protein OF83DRAFT_1172286 [Amylostereum chailletii]|nr:hypothetical protein OF83DRAFT_1172286 [Amylostereum chailletii]
MLASLPAETVQEVAFYLPAHRDVNALVLVNKHIQGVLKLGLVYKHRSINAGWNVQEGHDSPTSQVASLAYWKHIDVLYTRLDIFMAAASSKFSGAFASSWSNKKRNDIPDAGFLMIYIDLHILHRIEVFHLIVALCEAIRRPEILDNSRNVAHLLSKLYCNAWRGVLPYITSYLSLSFQLSIVPPVPFMPSKLDVMDTLLYEPCTFTMIALFTRGILESSVDHGILIDGKMAADLFFNMEIITLSIPMLDNVLPLDPATPYSVATICRAFSVCYTVQILLLFKICAQVKYPPGPFATSILDPNDALDELELFSPSNTVSPWAHVSSKFWDYGVNGTPLHPLVEGGAGSWGYWHGCAQCLDELLLWRSVFRVTVTAVSPTKIGLAVEGIGFDEHDGHVWRGGYDVRRVLFLLPILIPP